LLGSLISVGRESQRVTDRHSTGDLGIEIVWIAPFMNFTIYENLSKLAMSGKHVSGRTTTCWIRYSLPVADVRVELGAEVAACQSPVSTSSLKASCDLLNGLWNHSVSTEFFTVSSEICLLIAPGLTANKRSLASYCSTFLATILVGFHIS
jgi:hypothetical protein